MTVSTTGTGAGQGSPQGSGAVPARPGVGWTELVVAAVAYVVVGALVAVLFVAAGNDEPDATVLVTLTGVATLAAVGIALAVRVRSLEPLGLRRVGWRWLLAGLGAGIGVWLVNRLVIAAYIAVTGDTGNPQQAIADTAGAGGAALVGILLAGALLVPFAEELLFRGIAYSALRRYGVAVATVVSALLFGIAHGINVVLLGAIVLGIVNALMFERSRSVWPAVVAHVVNNAIVFATAAVLL